MKKRIKKYILIPSAIIFIILIIAAAGASLLFYFYPEDSVLDIIRTRAESSLGRKVDINSLNYSIRGIVLHGVTIHDTDETGALSGTHILKADEAVISYSLLSFIKKDYSINALYLKKLSLRWVFNKSGESNLSRLMDEIKAKSSATPESKTNLKIEEIILTGCSLDLINPPQDYKPLEGNYVLNGSIRLKGDDLFHFSEAVIELPSGRGKLFPDVDINLHEKLKITGKVKLENASLIWVYGFATKPLNLPFDTVNGTIDNFELSLPEIKGDVKATSTIRRSKGIVHAEGSCVVNIDDETVILKNVKNRLNSSASLLEDLFISTKAGEVRRFSVSNANYSISDLRLLESEIPSGFSGNIKGSLSLNSGKYNGKLQISDCSYKDRTEIFSGLNTDIELVNNVFKKENIPVTVFGTGFNFSIATTDSEFKSIYVLIKGDKLDVNKITLSSGKSASDFYFPLSITGKILLGELIYDKFTFRNNQVDFAAAKKNIKLNRVDTSVLSGSLTGSGNIDLSGEFPSAHINARFSSIKIHDLKFSEENLNNRLFGLADGTVNMGFKIKENMTETLKGNAAFNVLKGKVVNTGIQNGLIIFLAELRYKLKDLEFNRIYGNIDINGKDLMINTFIFNSEDIRLSMNGKLDSDLQANNMSMKLEFNNHFIKDIPRPAITVFSDYLNGKWYTIPFLLNGNITDSRNIKMLKRDQ